MRRECPTCGRLIYLNRDGLYRRHFGAQPDGSVRLCATSGHAPAGVVARALRRLDLSQPPRPPTEATYERVT